MNREDIPSYATVVVWRKSQRSKKKYMTVYVKGSLDQINTTRKKNPSPPGHEGIWEDIGLGASFIEMYMQKHKLKDYYIWPKQ